MVFDVVVPDVDESVLPDESPTSAALRLARDKARAVSASAPDAIVLAADTLVVHGSTALGKPRDLDQARNMLAALSGREHHVLTGVCLLRTQPFHEDAWVCDTRVWFRALDDGEVEEYLRRVDVLDKAGAYAIQEHGDLIIDRIDGLHSNVVGLPIETVLERLPTFC